MKKNLILGLILMTSLMFMVVGSVSAYHTSDVTVTTNDWLESDTETDFTVSVTNTDEALSIRKVIIYPSIEYPSFACGSAPTNWNLFVGSESCTYSTIESTEFITSGNSKDFTLQATTSSDAKDTWLVTTIDDVSDPYNNNPVPTGWTIKDAIIDAHAGDTIYVPAGEYDEFVYINKPVTLVSRDGAESTTINKGIKISADEVTVEGFTVLPSLILGETVGIYLDGDLDTVTIENNEIDGTGVSGSPRGIVVKTGADYTEVSIENNEIHDCITGIYTNPHTGIIDIENNEIYNTVAGIGGFMGANARYNLFHDNGEAIGADTSITGSDYVIEFNKFLEDNVNAYYNVLVIAENNWWGTSVKSEIEELTNGDVDYKPWCYDEMCSLSEPQEWVIPLYAGKMNLFSIPLMPTSTNIKNVLPEEISDKAIKIWSYQNGDWKYNTPTSTAWSTESGRLKKIEPGYGYMLFMNEDAVAYGNGRELGAEQLPTDGIELDAGWNLLGHYGLIPKNTEDALGSIDFGDNYRWDTVFELNSEGDGYVEIADYFFMSGTMESTKAYWVSVITDKDPVYS